MATGLRSRMLPEGKRRTLEELSDDLELRSGDTTAKQSAFWTMLLLSAVIATCGVLADSTATVIGAMIIAPLATPIMGIALAGVKRRSNGSLGFVLLGGLAVVLVGAAFSFALPDSYDLMANGQVAGRVQPGFLDLVAALATGLAGAVALARRDVAAVLPGVAIAISLVPPLAVVGVCFGRGELVLGAGALLLFLSNLVALVLAGLLVFTVLGYAAEDLAETAGSTGRTYLVFGVLLVAVVIPLAINTTLTYLVMNWEARVSTVATDWLADTSGSSVVRVELNGDTFELDVRTPADLPPTAELLDALDGQVPDGFGVEVVSTVGTTVDVGVVGG
jgi:uncharacterized hydrophobic protein (TIGR00271 family)